MKWWNYLVLFLIALALGLGIFNLAKERKTLEKETAKLEQKAEDLKKENASLISNLEYYKRPENLLKELKSQFNYKEEGEKLIIIVPKAR